MEEKTCKHKWEWLRERVHNKGDGKGKYKSYKCKICDKYQKRWLKKSLTFN